MTQIEFVQQYVLAQAAIKAIAPWALFQEVRAAQEGWTQMLGLGKTEPAQDGEKTPLPVETPRLHEDTA